MRHIALYQSVANRKVLSERLKEFKEGKRLVFQMQEDSIATNSFSRWRYQSTG